MDAYDPLKAAKVVGLPDELKNMGIDKEAIIPRAERVISPVEQEKKVTEQPNQETERLKAEIKAQQTKIAELDSRISNIVEKVNQALNIFNDKLENMSKQRPMQNDAAKQEEKQQTLGKTSQERAAGKDKLEPGDIAIEDYFNFSNAKFK